MSERVVFGFFFDEVTVEQQVAWRDWCRHHGIDPNDVPASCWIERDEQRRRIVHEAYARNELGQRYPDETGQDAAREVRVVQLEAVPSPFPSFS